MHIERYIKELYMIIFLLVNKLYLKLVERVF